MNGRDGDYPPCRSCEGGDLLPLSDYGPEGSSVRHKAWVCSDPRCGFVLRIDSGKVRADRYHEGSS